MKGENQMIDLVMKGYNQVMDCDFVDEILGEHSMSNPENSNWSFYTHLPLYQKPMQSHIYQCPFCNYRTPVPFHACPMCHRGTDGNVPDSLQELHHKIGLKIE